MAGEPRIAGPAPARWRLRALVLQHIACEPPGVYEDVLVERRAAIHRVELDEGDELPDWRAFDLIVAMGGPMSVNDESECPWLVAEKRAIAEAVRAGVPYWGVCLGVQLLAAALGARVYAGPEPEVGVLSVRLTTEAAADPVFGGLPAELATFQWHGDTFDLPDGAVLLAESPLYRNQAFRVGKAYGVQFHLELDEAILAGCAVVPAYVEAADRVLGEGALPGLLREADRALPALAASARVVFERWLDRVVLAPG